MAEMVWEKPPDEARKRPANAERFKFLVDGLLLIGAVVYLIFSGTSSGARYFLTVSEAVNNQNYVGQTVRLSGAVIGDTIDYDSKNLQIRFTIAHIPTETSDLALTLHQAVNDPSAARLPVFISNQVKPDLLQHESQAIITGKLGQDGVFYATELLLKCSSRYEESVPSQVSHDELKRG